MVTQIFAACHSSKNASTSSNKSNVPTSYGTTATTTNQQARLNYVDRFKAIAVREMERTGVPASIKLAQGLLESDAGRSTLANQANNHFGVKCHSDWQGGRYYKEDDDYDPVTKELLKSCFRVYKNADESFVAHSEFLRDPRKAARYGWLFQLPKTDYMAWAHGLEKSGYATASDYSEKLIKIIEDYQLVQFDGLTSGELPMAGTKPSSNNRPNDNFPTNGNQPAYTPPSGGGNRPTDPNQLPYFDPNNPSGSTASNGSTNSGNGNEGSGTYVQPMPDMAGIRNDVKYIRAISGQNLYEVAGKSGLRLENLQKFNEEVGNPKEPLAHGLVLYTQKKRNSWHGESKYHTVKDCETMYDISQKYAVKLSKLYSKNEMRDGEQPQIGERILLRRGWFQGTDKPALRDTFNEWRRCDVAADMKPQMSTPVARPGSSPGNVFDADISPNGGQSSPSSGQVSYPPPVQQPNYQTTTSYPTTSYPTTTTEYPTTSYPTTTTTEYPTTSYPTTSYPTTTTEYPTTSYPTTTTSSPSYPTYPSRPTTSYPSTKPKPSTASPAAKPSTAPKPTTAPAASATAQYHTVQPKETLWGLSQKYKLTVDALKKMNNMADNNLQIGQQLRVK
ncbi:MAG: glucosaminidase domain-containing protein [Saprospiraceae bacterium]|nr:glucosaminidase domain-containing protein [Saprospiraceae bacterium]